MKQYRITTENILTDSPDDCYLAPDDPIHALKAAHSLDGLGSAEKLREYSAVNANVTFNDNRGTIQREQNIKPGTDEWFKLWFSRKNN